MLRTTAFDSVGGGEPRSRMNATLDALERVVFIALLALLAYRFVPHLSATPVNLFFLMSEAFVVAMVALRPATTRISLRPGDWLCGFAGTFLPLLVVRGSGANVVAGGVLMLCGTIVAIGAQLSLRRSFGVVAANRGIKTAGLYEVVRHPMYLGYFCTQTGFLLVNPTPWNATILAIWTACQLWRIQAEERLLSADAIYQAFTDRVRYRLLPFVY